MDSHYASALFLYQKHFAVKYQQYSSYVFMDDKHHCKVGEPSCPVAAVERGKRVIVSLDHRFVVANHDHTKYSVVPSVAVVCSIPQSIDQSFYRGRVFVGIKDCVFEPSSPIRHATELNSILDTCGSNSPILLIYSDGGPDHRLTYLTTQISYICLFFVRDLDLLCAVRTPPYHSWKNPVERIMSILNLALHSVGLMRAQMSAEFEALIKSCNSMKAIRAAAEQHSGLREALLDSVSPVKALLSGLFLRLKLKDDPFSVFSAASTAEMDCFWNTILKIDCLMTKGDRTKQVLGNRPGLKGFLQHCCKARHYLFSIKKCGEQDCSICRPPRLPSEVFESLHHLPDPIRSIDGEHYCSFTDLYGQETSERDRPSLTDKSHHHKSHGMPFNPNAQYARCVNEFVICSECEKPRVLYAARKLHYQDIEHLKLMLEMALYTCGCSLQDLSSDGAKDPVMSRTFVRANLSCSDPIEIPYYSCQSFLDVCIHCGTAQDLVTNETDVYPTCTSCLSEKPKMYKRKRSHVATPGHKKKCVSMM